MKLTLLFLGLAIPAAQALDFTPIEAKMKGEAGTYSYVEFRDGRSRISYVPPKAWEFRGDSAAFRLCPPAGGSAEVEFHSQALKEPVEMEAENLKAFEAIARESLPPGATKIETLGLAFNPRELDGHKTVEVTLSYGFFGQTIKASLLYVVRQTAPVRFRVDSRASASLARDASLVVFRVAARAADFDRARDAIHQSLGTLSGL